MKNLFIATCCSILFACSMAPLDKNVIKQTPDNVIVRTKSISVTKVVDTISQGSVVGKYYSGLFSCVSRGDSRWIGNEKLMNSTGDIVRSKLEKYGYSLVGKAYSPFSEEYAKQSDLLLGGKLVDVKANTCRTVSGVKGEVYIKIDWEIYDNKTKKVILMINTEGYDSSNEPNKFGDKDLYEKAFDMAI